MADAILETSTELVSANETCRELTSQYSESRRREMCALACPNCGSTDLQWVFKHSRPKFKFGSLVCHGCHVLYDVTPRDMVLPELTGQEVRV